jgi:hypothetical protein
MEKNVLEIIRKDSYSHGMLNARTGWWGRDSRESEKGR